MAQQNQKIDQISLYRIEQKLKYEKILRGEYLYNKYQKLIELNPIKRSASRIVNAVKKYLLHTPINEDALLTIPGQFRLRLPMTELNTFPLEIQKEFFRNAKGNTNLSQVILKSLKESYPLLYWIVIDLRIYGPCPEMEIYLLELSQTLYLSEDQINKVKHVWSEIDPEIDSGIKFQQMLDSSKSLAILYSLSKNINYINQY